MILFLKIFLLALTLSLLITPLVKKLALRLNIVDTPNPPLKDHIWQTPKLGGLAIFLSLFLAISGLFFLSDFKIVKVPPNYQYGWGGYYVCPTIFNNNAEMLQPNIYANKKIIVSANANNCRQTGIPLKYLIGILIGALFLLIGGILDDKYNLKPSQQIIFPILAILAVIASGIAPHNISNPFYYLKLSADPLIHLEFFKIKIFTLNSVPYYLTLISDAVTFCWLFLLIYTTKFLDGLDGLVAGLAVISGGFLFIISFAFGQPLIAALCLFLSASYLGFLPFNFLQFKKANNNTEPQLRTSGKIFLGEAGSTLAGYSLGVLAILGEAKITATILLLGIPIIDALWVICQRLIKDRQSPFLGDRKHLHFRLLTKGLSSKKSVLLLWGLCFVFGSLGLVMQDIGRLISLIILLIFTIVLLRLGYKPHK